MFDSKYSKVLTIILIVVIVAIVLILGFLTFDYIRKINTSKQASNFVDSYQSEIKNGNNQNITGDTQEPIQGNITIDPSETQTSIGSTNNSSSRPTKKKYQNLTVAGTMKIPTINLEYPIVEETTATALEKALVVLYPNGDNLNQPGNTVVWNIFLKFKEII